MRTTCSFLILAVFLALPALATADHIPWQAFCKERLQSAAFHLVALEFPERYDHSMVSVPHKNDAMFMDKERECMGNVGILFFDDINSYRWGIFHIHAGTDGHVISSAPVTDWKRGNFDDRKTLAADWCDFINKVYPAQAETEGCGK